MLFIASGFQTDALVSDYSSKANPSTGQKACWAAPPVEASSWRSKVYTQVLSAAKPARRR